MSRNDRMYVQWRGCYRSGPPAPLRVLPPCHDNPGSRAGRLPSTSPGRRRRTNRRWKVEWTSSLRADLPRWKRTPPRRESRRGAGARAELRPRLRCWLPHGDLVEHGGLKLTSPDPRVHLPRKWQKEVLCPEPDRAAGRRTTASVIGRVPAKLLMTVLMLFEAGLVS